MCTHSSPLSAVPLLSIPQNTTSWTDFFLRLFFEADGVTTTTIFCLGAFLIYRMSGSPLDVSVEEKQVEREELLLAHNERFKPNNARNRRDTGGRRRVV